MTINNEIHFNNLSLKRFPTSKKETLRAWDAADEYVLDVIHEKNLIKANENVLVFNDSFGAICLSLCHSKTANSITVMTDSINAENGIIENANNNNISINLFNIISSLDTHTHVYNHIIIKPPKSLDALKFFISNVLPFTNKETNIMIAGMVKHMPKTLWSLLEENLGQNQTSLTKKKAKIISVKITKNTITSNYPKTFLQDNAFTIYNHAAVFSKASLDIGTRFLLENLPELENINDIIDLGCGNGVLGLNLAKQYPNARITFTDESYMAVASAKLTVQNNTNTMSNMDFKVKNCLDGFENNSADFIVCNPPFHQSQNIGIQIALNMFEQSFKTLRKNGVFIVIANRHLPYFSHLKRIFNQVTTHASNRKFNVFLMKKA